MIKTKFNYSSILKYMALIFISLVLANASIVDVSPFLYSFLFACIYVGIDEKFAGLTTVVCSVATNPTLETFFIAISVVAIGLVCFYIHK